VIVADEHYHALGLYESLGFERAERVLGVCRPPSA
jgi:ribosomal protein S18 acetylase RimI-like enzyme